MSKELASLEKDESLECKNCGQVLNGNYCPECGQSVKNFDKPFRFIIADFAGNIFAFDSRILNTLKAILIQPGQLANDITHGRRARYMPPFRFYIFVSFLFFLLLNYTSNGFEDFNIGKQEDSLALVADSTSGIPTLSVEISDTSHSLFDNLNGIEIPAKPNSKLTDSLWSSPIRFSEDVEIDFKDVLEHKDLYWAKFLGNISTSMFFLMPWYGFLLWVFFRKTYKYYLGHLVLAINQHIFSYLIFIVILFIGMMFPNKTASYENYLIWVLPIYFVIGARKLYGRKWTTTLMRMSVIGFLYVMLLVVVIVGATFLSMVKDVGS